MSIYKRPGSKFYWYKFTFDGELVQRSSKCTNRADARTVRDAHRTQLALGKIGIEPEKEVPIFEKAVENFLEWSKVNHAQKPESFRRVKYSAEPLKKFFGKTKVDKIKTSDIEKFIIWRSKQISRKTKEPISHDTINMELIVLKTVFGRLYDAGILKKNPARSVKLLPKNKFNFYVLSADDERRYLMACGQPLQDVATIILATGMRPSEVYNLKRQNVFLKKDFLQIVDGKTASSNRRIWFSDEVRKILEIRLNRFKGDYLFPKGEIDLNPPTYEQNFAHRAALKRIGLKFRIYDLRHTFATRVLESGVDLLTLASMLGHSSLDQVMRYAHPSEARKADAMRSMQKKAKAV